MPFSPLPPGNKGTIAFFFWRGGEEEAGWLSLWKGELGDAEERLALHAVLVPERKEGTPRAPHY